MGIVPLRKVGHNTDYAESWFDSTYPHYRSVRELAQHAGLEPVVCGFDSHQTDYSWVNTDLALKLPLAFGICGLAENAALTNKEAK